MTQDVLENNLKKANLVLFIVFIHASLTEFVNKPNIVKLLQNNVECLMKSAQFIQNIFKIL